MAYSLIGFMEELCVTRVKSFDYLMSSLSAQLKENVWFWSFADPWKTNWNRHINNGSRVQQSYIKTGSLVFLINLQLIPKYALKYTTIYILLFSWWTGNNSHYGFLSHLTLDTVKVDWDSFEGHSQWRLVAGLRGTSGGMVVWMGSTGDVYLAHFIETLDASNVSHAPNWLLQWSCVAFVWLTGCPLWLFVAAGSWHLFSFSPLNNILLVSLSFLTLLPLQWNELCSVDEQEVILPSSSLFPAVMDYLFSIWPLNFHWVGSYFCPLWESASPLQSFRVMTCLPKTWLSMNFWFFYKSQNGFLTF